MLHEATKGIILPWQGNNKCLDQTYRMYRHKSGFLIICRAVDKVDAY